MPEELIQKLKKIASRKCWSDDEEFIPDDYAGGNIDDAYSGGVDDGRVDMAREILAELGVEIEA